MKTNLDSAQLYDKTIHADWITEPVTDTQYAIEETEDMITAISFNMVRVRWRT